MTHAGHRHDHQRCRCPRRPLFGRTGRAFSLAYWVCLCIGNEDLANDSTRDPYGVVCRLPLAGLSHTHDLQGLGQAVGTRRVVYRPLGAAPTVFTRFGNRHRERTSLRGQCCSVCANGMHVDKAERGSRLLRQASDTGTACPSLEGQPSCFLEWGRSSVLKSVCIERADMSGVWDVQVHIPR